MAPGGRANFSRVTRLYVNFRRIRSLCLVTNACSFTLVMENRSVRSVTVFITGGLSAVSNILSANARFVVHHCGSEKTYLFDSRRGHSKERLVL